MSKVCATSDKCRHAPGKWKSIDIAHAPRLQRHLCAALRLRRSRPERGQERCIECRCTTLPQPAMFPSKYTLGMLNPPARWGLGASESAPANPWLGNIHLAIVRGI
jgi:hypothetical protein